MSGRILLLGLAIQSQHPELIRPVMREVDNTQSTTFTCAFPPPAQFSHAAGAAYQPPRFWVLHHELLQLGIFVIIEVRSAYTCESSCLDESEHRPIVRLWRSSVNALPHYCLLSISGIVVCHTDIAMPKTKVAVELETDLLNRIDELVARQRFRNRSQVIEAALGEKLQRLARKRLAFECTRLDPTEEQVLAEEGLAGSLETWREY